MDYSQCLREAHQIEVSGEAFYAVMARRARRPERRDKWLALEKLETQTKNRVAAAAAAIGATLPERKADVRLGRVVAALLALLPWGLQMRAMHAITVHATRTWERMQRDCTGGDPRLLAELVAHEVAQVDFAVEELRGRSASSLPHVLKALHD